jgi:prepilin-type N-terminal cleavage/methylation domain-containing protein
MRRTTRAEDGFTLLELLLVIAILGIIVVPLGASILIGFRTTDATANRIESSHDAQMASIYFPADLQSAGNAQDDVVVAPTPNSDCSGVQNLVVVHWMVQEQIVPDETGGATDYITHNYQAAYAFTTSAGGRTALTRFYCKDGSEQTRTVVARNLDPASPGSATSEGRSVTVTLNEAGVNRDPNKYTYSITGTRRTP